MLFYLCIWGKYRDDDPNSKNPIKIQQKKTKKLPVFSSNEMSCLETYCPPLIEKVILKSHQTLKFYKSHQTPKLHFMSFSILKSYLHFVYMENMVLVCVVIHRNMFFLITKLFKQKEVCLPSFRSQFS